MKLVKHLDESTGFLNSDMACNFLFFQVFSHSYNVVGKTNFEVDKDRRKNFSL